MSRRSRLNFHNVDIENYRTENNKDYEAVVNTVFGADNENQTLSLLTLLVAALKFAVLVLVLILTNKDTAKHDNLWSESAGSLVLLLALVDFTNILGETIKVDDALIALLGLTYSSHHEELGLAALGCAIAAKMVYEGEDIGSDLGKIVPFCNLKTSVEKILDGSAREKQIKMLALLFLGVSSLTLLVPLGDAKDPSGFVWFGAGAVWLHLALVLIPYVLEILDLNPWFKLDLGLPYLSSNRTIRLLATTLGIASLAYGLSEDSTLDASESSMVKLGLGSYVVASMLGNALDRQPGDSSGLYL